MIVSFADKNTEKIFDQLYTDSIPKRIQKIALRKLIMIDNAKSIEDLRVPPGNRLEQLKGKRNGQWSIRINNKYRICFKVNNDIFSDVEITDYH